MVNEILNDIFVNVKTPTPPPPNIRDPLIFCYLFENNNKKLRLHFDKPIMDKYFEIIKEISELTGEPIPDSEIDCSISFLYDNIKKIKNDVNARHLQHLVKYLIQSAENKAYDRSFAYTTMHHKLESIALSIPEICDQLCQDQGIPEFNFVEFVEMTQEEKDKHEEEKKAANAEYYKKTKKKPKTDRKSVV